MAKNFDATTLLLFGLWIACLCSITMSCHSPQNLSHTNNAKTANTNSNSGGNGYGNGGYDELFHHVYYNGNTYWCIAYALNYYPYSWWGYPWYSKNYMISAISSSSECTSQPQTCQDILYCFQTYYPS